MALTLEDLAARVEELAREKVSAAQHVAALEQEVVALRAMLASRSGAVPDAPEPHALLPQGPRSAHEVQGPPDTAVRVQPQRGARWTRRGPITRLGLIATAAAAGAYAVMPVPAHAETQDGLGVATAPQIGATVPIKSPNGLFVLDVTNGGIFLTGPGGRVEVTLGEVIIHGTASAKVQAPLLHLNAGSVLSLNNGTRPVARIGDSVTVPVGGTGTIATGAPTVLA